MAPDDSSTSILPWTWVLGALSCSRKVDTSLLIDIVKRAPEITDELEKNVREMVTLRILEDLSNEENQIENKDTCALGEKEELSSNNTEDVVQHILAEMSAENPEILGPEVLNRDVQSFIVHKRTSLPMCALQKIKEAIIGGGSPVFESLRERSGLSVRTPCHSNNKVNHGHFDCLGQGLGECSRKIVGNGQEESRSELPDRNLAPASINKASISGENWGKQSSNDQTENDEGSNKNLKLDSNITSSNVVQYSNGSSTYSASTNASDGMVQYNGTDSYHLQNEVEVGSATPQDQDGGINPNYRDTNLLLSKMNTAEKSDNDFDSHAEGNKGFKPDVKNLVLNPIFSTINGMPTISSDMVVEGTPTGICNLVKATPLRAVECSQSSLNCEMQNAEQQHSPSHDADDHLPSLPEVEVYNNQVAELPALLNGKKDGVVGGNGHCGNLEPRKLNYVSSINMEKEMFHKHPANANGFKGNVSRNVLNDAESNDDISSSSDLELTSDGEEHNDGRMYGSLNKDPLLSLHGTYSQESFATQPSSCIKCNGDGELLICCSNSCQMVVHQSCLRSAATFDESGNFLCPFCAYARSISECLEIKKKNALARKNLAMFIGVQKKSTLTSDGAEHGQSKRIGEFGIDNEGSGAEVLGNKALKSHPLGHREIGNQADPPKSYLGDNPLAELKRFSPRSAKRKTYAENSEEDREKYVTSRDSKKRSRNSGKHFSDPAIPHLRRKPLPWSKEEEEKLKEGLQKLMNINDTKVPWSSVLKYGAGTFQSSRTSIDLRDKWRNMCKASPSKK